MQQLGCGVVCLGNPVDARVSQVVLVSPEMPLMQFGGINTGRYQAGAMPESTHIFSWPMNNSWTTNFNAFQTGTHRWFYSMTSGANQSEILSNRFGWGIRVPFLTRVLPGGGAGDELWSESVIRGWPENVLLVSAKPSREKGAVFLHVREIGGKETSLFLRGPEDRGLRMLEADVLGQKKQDGSLLILPYESKFYLLHF